ncbi:hypothetical protein H312_02940 [Anncaliia algerae PRA339]|uniref:Uncharacterized protein n=1 Tax=Anncaliia algerae PRA339 TaxID=1288291 RepID=A0A059EXC2_9MICR|nr:hypothetical protein H312_02940 [Anncaliia algerae PRA339]
MHIWIIFSVLTDVVHLTSSFPFQGYSVNNQIIYYVPQLTRSDNSCPLIPIPNMTYYVSYSSSDIYHSQQSMPNLISRNPSSIENNPLNSYGNFSNEVIVQNPPLSYPTNSIQYPVGFLPQIVTSQMQMVNNQYPVNMDNMHFNNQNSDRVKELQTKETETIRIHGKYKPLKKCDEFLLLSYGINHINEDNYHLLCIQKCDDILVISYHCCYAKIPKSSCLTYLEKGKPCISTIHSSNPCLQIWFDKSWIKKQQIKALDEQDIISYKTLLLNHIIYEYNSFSTMFKDEDLKNLLDTSFDVLKNNKMSITFFFEILAFRINGLKNSCRINSEVGVAHNLFYNISKPEIDLMGSCIVCLNWWKQFEFDEKRLEKNIILIFNVILRKFFSFSPKNSSSKALLAAFLTKITKTFYLLNS